MGEISVCFSANGLGKTKPRYSVGTSRYSTLCKEREFVLFLAHKFLSLEIKIMLTRDKSSLCSPQDRLFSSIYTILLLYVQL